MNTKLFSLLFLFLSISVVSAQMDNMFYFPKKEMKSVQWSKSEYIKLPVTNDTITALMLFPDKKPKATILFFHGAGGNMPDYLFMVAPLLNDGFQVAMVDFRGYGNSTGVPTHLNIADDAQKFFDNIVKRNDVKKTKVLIYGASIGTQVATRIAKDNASRINGLILDGTISSFGDIAAYYSPENKVYLEKNYASPYSPKVDILSLEKTPKLFIHSKDDKDVPFVQGKNVYDLANGKKVFIEYSGKHLEAMKTESVRILAETNKML